MRFSELNFHLIGECTLVLVFGLSLTLTSCNDDDYRCGIDRAFVDGPNGPCSQCATQDGNLILGNDEQFCYVPGSYGNYMLNGFSFGDSTIAGSVSNIYILTRDSSSITGNPVTSVGNLQLGYFIGSDIDEADPWGVIRCQKIEPNTILFNNNPVITSFNVDPPDPYLPDNSSVSFIIMGFDATGDCHEDWGYASGYADGDTVRLKVYWRAVDFPHPTGDTVLIDSAFIFPLPAYLE